LSDNVSKRGRIQKKVDIEKIKEIIRNINSFIDETSSSDKTIYEKILTNQAACAFNASKIIDLRNY
jgi:hypothetical protein